uniref:Uncharacterized protein n=1 Tax=Oryzias sinensis TaxID=183150 RepID=A0A8C8DS17_9TELE
MAVSREAESEPRLYGCGRAASAALTHLISVILTAFMAFLSRPGTSESFLKSRTVPHDERRSLTASPLFLQPGFRGIRSS